LREKNAGPADREVGPRRGEELNDPDCSRVVEAKRRGKTRQRAVLLRSRLKGVRLFNRKLDR